MNTTSVNDFKVWLGDFLELKQGQTFVFDDMQIVLVPENTVLGSWTVIWAQLEAVFVPSVAVNATV